MNSYAVSIPPVKVNPKPNIPVNLFPVNNQPNNLVLPAQPNVNVTQYTTPLENKTLVSYIGGLLPHVSPIKSVGKTSGLLPSSLHFGQIIPHHIGLYLASPLYPQWSFPHSIYTSLCNFYYTYIGVLLRFFISSCIFNLIFL